MLLFAFKSCFIRYLWQFEKNLGRQNQEIGYPHQSEKSEEFDIPETLVPKMTIQNAIGSGKSVCKRFRLI